MVRATVQDRHSRSESHDSRVARITDRRERERLMQERAVLEELDTAMDLVALLEVDKGVSRRIYSSASHKLVLGHEPQSCNGDIRTLTHLYPTAFLTQEIPQLQALVEAGELPMPGCMRRDTKYGSRRESRSLVQTQSALTAFCSSRATSASAADWSRSGERRSPRRSARGPRGRRRSLRRSARGPRGRRHSQPSTPRRSGTR